MKNIEINLNNMKLLNGKKIKLCSLMLTGLLTACSLDADCDISEYHAHKYYNEDGFVRYLNEEFLNYDGYTRDDEFIYLNEEDKYLNNFIKYKDLLLISDNIDLINNIVLNNKDYIEYRYSYLVLESDYNSIYNNYPLTLKKRYSWTKDASHENLTGEERLCHYVYNAYKLEKNDKGKYVVIKSEYSDNIYDLMDEYPYIKTDFYRIIDVKDDSILDYEDGPEDENINDKNELDQSIMDDSNSKVKIK
jgi:hypothetical protein